MSYEEKVTWSFFGVTVIAFVGYMLWLLPKFFGPNVTQISYVTPMLIAIGLAIIAAIIANISISITQGTRRDERDREIERYGQVHSQFITEIGALVALGMAMARLEHFWIAHTLYVVCVGNAVLGCILKIMCYRQGFAPN
jgi:drug/metabolite transporter (DMT)-like permease